MVWSEQTKAALRHWLGASTWNTSHPSDMTRFFRFVASVWNDEHALWDESAAREVMANEAKKLYPNGDDLIAEVIEKRMREGTTVLDFLSLVRDDNAFSLITER